MGFAETCLLSLIEASDHGGTGPGCTLRRGRYRTRVDSEKIPGLSETNQGAPSI